MRVYSDPKIVTRYAKNETTVGVTDSVKTILMPSDSEWTRQLPIGSLSTDWKTLAIYWKMSIENAPSDGNFSGLLAAGVCSKDRSFGKIYTPNRGTSDYPHFLGVSTNGGSGGHLPGTWTGVKDTSAVPGLMTGENMCFSYPTWPLVYGSDTTQGASGTSTLVCPRYDMNMSGSYASESISGYGWTQTGLIIAKDDLNNSYSPGTDAVRTYWFTGADIGLKSQINMPSRVYRFALSDIASSGNDAAITYNNWYNEVDARNFADGLTKWTNHTSLDYTGILDEATYGSLDTLNFYWRATGSNRTYEGINLLIRDIIIIRWSKFDLIT